MKKKSLKSFFGYEILLYFVFAILIYLLNKTNNLNKWSFICGIMLLPITNFIYDLFRKFRWKSEKNI